MKKLVKKTALYRLLRDVYFGLLQFVHKHRAIKQYSETMENTGNIIAFNEPKVCFYLPYYKEDLIQLAIITTRNYYEIDYLNYVCKVWKNGCIGEAIKGNTILDIGSNIGNHSLFFLLECSACMAYIFEPIKDTFEIMKKNIEINNLEKNAVLYNMGVGECETTAEIKGYSKKNTGGASLEINSTGNIKMCAIDNLNIHEKVGLIKIDTEGFEIGVVKGMVNLIRENHPYIMIEIQPNNFDEINNILMDIGYTYEIYDEYNHLYFYNE